MADSSYLPLDDIYYPEVDVEYFEEYSPGGYHPTLIGDTFYGGRYTVVHKLGFGGYSKIWLAWDLGLATPALRVAEDTNCEGLIR